MGNDTEMVDHSINLKLSGASYDYCYFFIKDRKLFSKHLKKNLWINHKLHSNFTTSSFYLSFFYVIYERTQNVYNRPIWRPLNSCSMLLERKLVDFNPIESIFFKAFHFRGFFRDWDIAIKISLANTELRSVTPFVLICFFL